MEPFNCDDTRNIGNRWEEWLTRLEHLFGVSKVSDDNQKLNGLFFYGGKRLHAIYKTIPDNKTDHRDEDGDLLSDYKVAIKRLNAYFLPKRRTAVEIFKFNKLIQESNENIEQYITRLREAAAYCAFDNTDAMIMNHVIYSCKSNKLRRKLLEIENPTLDDLLKTGRLYDSIETQAKALEETLESNDIGYKNKNKHKNKLYQNKQHHYKQDMTNKPSNHYDDEKKCWFCGGEYPHKQKCPAEGKSCNICGKANHFGKVCLSKKSMNKHARTRMQKINAIDKFKIEEVHNDKHEFQQNIYAVSGGKQPLKTIQINGHPVDMKIDTGASVNILDELTFSRLRLKGKLQPYTNSLYAYNQESPLPTLGTFKATLKYKDYSILTDLIIIKGNSGNLIGYDTCIALKLIQVVDDIQDEHNDNNTREKWLEKYPKVFKNEIGKLKNFQLKLHIDTTFKPIQAKPRIKPIQIEEAVEKEIQKMLKDDIIEKVGNKPTEWLNETVQVMKKGTNNLRLCVDMKLANKAIKREIYQMPSIDHIISKVNNMKIFTKLDLKSAFHQIELDPDSRRISRFRTASSIYDTRDYFSEITIQEIIFRH